MGNLNYSRLNFYENNLIIKPDRQYPHNIFKNFRYSNYIKYRDSSITAYLFNEKEKKEKLKFKILERNMIVIHPGESLFFEETLTLPIEFYDEALNFVVVDFNYNKEYFSKINFDLMKKKNVLKYLTESQLRTIEENNYKIFEGELTSQKIPVEFID